MARRTIWHPETLGKSKAGADAVGHDLWRLGWQAGPQVAPSLVSEGKRRKIAVCGHSYCYVGISDSDNYASTLLDVQGESHGRWRQQFATSADVSWLSHVSGTWKRYGSPIALRLDSGTGSRHVLFDSGDPDGEFLLDWTGNGNYSNVILRGTSPSDCIRLVGSASFAGWTAQVLVGGAVVWSSVQGLTGFSAGKWRFRLVGSQLRTFSPTGGGFTIQLPDIAPMGTLFGVEQSGAIAAGTLAIKAMGWTGLEMLGVSGSAVAIGDSNTNGAWPTVYQRLPILGKDDGLFLLWGINDDIAQTSRAIKECMEAVISFALATSRKQATSADVGVISPPQGPGNYGLWTEVFPDPWRHSGRSVLRTITVGAKAKIGIGCMGEGMIGLRFINPPNSGGAVTIKDQAGNVLIPSTTIANGNSWGQAAARTLRLKPPPSATDLVIEVTAINSGGEVIFDGWHPEANYADQPRIVWANSAHLGPSPPSPWSAIAPTTIDNNNATKAAYLGAAFPTDRVRMADINAAIGGNDAMFGGDDLHPNEAGAAAIATTMVAAMNAIQ